MRKVDAVFALVALLGMALPAAAQLSPQMRDGIANAKFVPAYSVKRRRQAAQALLKRAMPPALGETASLTPDTPYGPGGAHLSVWKPSFVLGTPSGGEAGFNFWGIHDDGHVNVGFTARAARRYMLDCRLLSAGNITYKTYVGAGDNPRDRGEQTLKDGHLLLLIAAPASDETTSVELWPTPRTSTMGFLGCDLAAIDE